MKSEKKIELFILILVLSASMLGLLEMCVPRVSCEEQIATVSISPATREVDVGENFTVDVNVASVLELYHLQLRLDWNASILNVTDALEGDLLSKEGGPTFFFKEVSTPVEGLYKMYVGCTLLGNATGVSGNGTIASITFLAIAPGETSLDISETSYRELGGDVIVKGTPASSVLSKESVQVGKQQSAKVAAPQDPLWTVRDPNDGPNDFPTIQAAIFSPNVANGDTIHVFAGADGPIIVTKTLRIIGQGIAVTTINGGGANAVTIGADNVFITEFTITGGNAGILCATWNGLTISNNDISGNRVGVVLFKSTKDTILGNSITTNLCGILLWGSTSVMVRANDISANVLVGILLIPPVTGNVYYNNFVNNLVHVWPIGCAAPGITIVWDDNAVYGAFKGNYWAQPPVPCPGDRGPLPGPWVRKKEDVNLDGSVNIIDISIAAAAFGTKWSNPRWNPKADIDGNGKIDIIDIARIARWFGWKDP